MSQILRYGLREDFLVKDKKGNGIRLCSSVSFSLVEWFIELHFAAKFFFLNMNTILVSIFAYHAPLQKGNFANEFAFICFVHCTICPRSFVNSLQGSAKMLLFDMYHRSNQALVLGNSMSFYHSNRMRLRSAGSESLLGHTV